MNLCASHICIYTQNMNLQIKNSPQIWGLSSRGALGNGLIGLALGPALSRAV